MAGEELTTELFGLYSSDSYSSYSGLQSTTARPISPQWQWLQPQGRGSCSPTYWPWSRPPLPTHTPHTPAPQPEVLAGYWLPTTDYQQPTTDYQLPTTNHRLLTTNQWPVTTDRKPLSTDHLYQLQLQSQQTEKSHIMFCCISYCSVHRIPEQDQGNQGQAWSFLGKFSSCSLQGTLLLSN